MTNWTARAKAEILETGNLPTAKTDETQLLSVSSVPTGVVLKFPERVSSVSSVGVWAIFENSALAADLIEAAMKVCDLYGDGEAAREEMRRQCLELSPELQSDLLDHFRAKGE